MTELAECLIFMLVPKVYKITVVNEKIDGLHGHWWIMYSAIFIIGLLHGPRNPTQEVLYIGFCQLQSLVHVDNSHHWYISKAYCQLWMFMFCAMNFRVEEVVLVFMLIWRMVSCGTIERSILSRWEFWLYIINFFLHSVHDANMY
jgi:hypothetical protein